MKSLRLVAGSFVVYFAMAIAHGCSSSTLPMLTTGTGSGGGSSSGGHGGSSASTVGHVGASVASSSASGKGGHGGAGGAGGIMNPVGDADAETSGSRLKANRIVGTDGSTQFSFWYDTQRNEQCYFSFHTKDGLLRCLPSQGEVDGGYVNGSFIDAACTMQAVIAQSTACPNKYVLTYELATTACGFPTVRIFPIGAKLMPQPTVLYLKSGTSCVSTPAPSPGNNDFYALGAEVDPASFVATTIVQDP